MGTDALDRVSSGVLEASGATLTGASAGMWRKSISCTLAGAVVRFAILGVSPSDILGFSVSQRSNLRQSQCADVALERRHRGRGGRVGLGWPPPGGHGQGPLSIY